MPAYNSGFSLPAPVAGVVVTHPVRGVHRRGLRGKLDSGADNTVIPERLVTQLGLTPRGHAWTEGFDGTYSRRPVFYVRMGRGQWN